MEANEYLSIVIQSALQLVNGYALYLLMNGVFKRSSRSRYVIIGAYLAFTLSVLLIFVIVKVPLIQIVNYFICVILLSYLHSDHELHRIIKVLTIVGVGSAIEILVSIAIGYTSSTLLHRQEGHVIWGGALSTIIKLLVGYGSLRIKNSSVVKKSTRGIIVFLAPLSSIVTLLVSVGYFKYSIRVSMLLLFVSIVLITISYFIYRQMEIISRKEYEVILKENRNELYLKQLRLLQKRMDDLKKFKHDFSKIIMGINTSLKAGEYNAIEKSISEYQDIFQGHYESYSGNVIIDSILNYYLTILKENNIMVDMEIAIPKILSIDGIDLYRILGNLIENAIEALSAINDEKKKLDIEIVQHSDSFLIRMENPITKLIEFHEGIPKSSKLDKDNHGLGLKTISEIITSYSGSINFKVSKDIYCCTIVIPIELI